MSSLITLDQLQTSLEEITPSITALGEIFGSDYTGFTRLADSTVGAYSFAYGYTDTITASGEASHAEGSSCASGSQSHAEGNATTASAGSSHSEGSHTTASGASSHAEGYSTTASGAYSHAEGYESSTHGAYSHAEGYESSTYGAYSHAEGRNTCTGNSSGTNNTYGSYAHAEGYGTLAYASTLTSVTNDNTTVNVDCSHAEGCNTKATGACSHAEGYNTTASSKNSHAEGNGTTTSNINSHAEGYATIASGSGAHAEGYNTTASGSSAHAEGYSTTASGTYSHAEGYNVTASGSYGSHAEGYKTKATGDYGSHAEGANTTASGNYSHAEGNHTTAASIHSSASGYYTETYTANEFVIGQFNTVSTTAGSATTTTGNVFVIGNGTSDSALSNAFRVTKTGYAYGLAAYTSSGADYAEFIKEWADGNEDNEDRVGYFVTIRDGLLYKANEGDYIAGITSGNPSIIGNGDEDYYWRFERDEFNRFIMEDVEEEVEQTDEDGNIVIDEETGEAVMVKTGNIIKNGRFKWNEDYDASQEYVERKDRPEWDYVGMMGVLPVRDDGTCVAGSYCKCGVDGVATAADTWTMGTYFVIERISDSVVSVIMK